MLWVVAAAPFLLAGLAALVSAGQYLEARLEATAIASSAARAAAAPEPGDIRRVADHPPAPGSGPADPGRGAAVALRPAEARARALTVTAAETAVDEVVVRLAPPPGTVRAGRAVTAVTVEVRLVVDYRFPVPGMPASVRGLATAVGVESGG